MKKKDINESQEIKPDLKHDTMEYAASTDNENTMNEDEQRKIDEDEITAEELAALEEDPIDEQAAALNSVETDRQADNDVNFNENDKEE